MDSVKVEPGAPYLPIMRTAAYCLFARPAEWPTPERPTRATSGRVLDPGRRKALLQITERCDLRCAHCFVSATANGSDMTLQDITSAIPRLQAAHALSHHLDGWRTVLHIPRVLRIVELFGGQQLRVTICTNAVAITPDQMPPSEGSAGISVNVSLERVLASQSRPVPGERASFDVTVANARLLAHAGLLKGHLVYADNPPRTPNTQSSTASPRRLAAE